MRYLLDTNICIYLMKRRPADVLSRFETLIDGDVGMSVVTYAELRAGIVTSSTDPARDEQAIAALIDVVPVVAFSAEDAEEYGRLRLAVKGRRRDALDRLIAAHAKSLGVTLVTNNETDFEDYAGLRIENWVSAE